MNKQKLKAYGEAWTREQKAIARFPWVYSLTHTIHTRPTKGFLVIQFRRTYLDAAGHVVGSFTHNPIRNKWRSRHIPLAVGETCTHYGRMTHENPNRWQRYRRACAHYR